MSGILVKLSNVSKHYKSGKRPVVKVLDNMNLSINQGDFLALMGPSGSGKTTLLNLIAGLDQVTAGSIEFDGQDIAGFSQRKLTSWRARNVGFIFQFYNLMPMLSAQKNVELPLLLTGLSAAERQQHASTALQVVGLSERVHHKPAELSGGQEQRVAIARALVSDPKILVCDEPTGDLDRATADEILELLRLLNKEHGKTIVMVTHDPKAAEYAQHCLSMDKGLLTTSNPIHH